MSAVLDGLPPLPDLDRLPPMDVASRLDRLRGIMTSSDDPCDALFLTNLVSIRYLTGFTGSAALVLVTGDGLLFVTDGRYAEQAEHQLGAAGVTARIEVSGTEQRQIVAGTAAALRRVGLEADDVTWARQRAFDAKWFPDAEVVATQGLVEQLRLVKDGGEVARIEAAAIIADHALAHIRPRLSDRPSEQDVALELDSAMRRLGATDRSFETIIGSGPNGAMPHARPTNRVIDDGDLVVIDFGAIVDGYCSDMTRTIAVGALSATQQRMLDVVGESQQAGVDAVRAGSDARSVDAACRAVIADAGWSEAFVHGTGHGVGLEIHEAPRVAATAVATLEPGHIITVEPGVYLPEHGGVRIEDTLVVTATGGRCLTHSTKRTTV